MLSWGMNNIYKFLRNKIFVSKTFWRFRHLIHSDFLSNYYESHSIDRRFFYSDLVNKNLYKTVFEFGSATGPNLKNIELYCRHKPFLFGFEINNAAVDFAKRKFDSKTAFFSSIINEDIFINLLNGLGVNNFDLAIYDRVLYLLNENEVVDHFSKFHKYFNCVVIDDFHNSLFLDKNDVYSSKNYQKILSSFGFKLITNEKSKHLISDDFFDRSARRLVFQKF